MAILVGLVAGAVSGLMALGGGRRAFSVTLAVVAIRMWFER